MASLFANARSVNCESLPVRRFVVIFESIISGQTSFDGKREWERALETISELEMPEPNPDISPRGLSESTNISEPTRVSRRFTGIASIQGKKDI
jgi:hypothetical protein